MKRLIILLLVPLLLAALIFFFGPMLKKEAAPPPVIAPFGDSIHWVLVTPLRYRVGELQERITIPKGFVTDLASVPQIFWSVLPKTDKYMSAAILHDYLYWDQRCTQQQADALLKQAMDEFGVSAEKSSTVYDAVRFFGASSWKQNRKNNDAGNPRIMTEQALNDFLDQDLNATRSWENIQRELIKSGVGHTPDLGNPDIAAICMRAAKDHAVAGNERY